jgi:hypothetical protein
VAKMDRSSVVHDVDDVGSICNVNFRGVMESVVAVIVLARRRKRRDNIIIIAYVCR